MKTLTFDSFNVIKGLFEKALKICGHSLPCLTVAATYANYRYKPLVLFWRGVRPSSFLGNQCPSSDPSIAFPSLLKKAGEQKPGNFQCVVRSLVFFSRSTWSTQNFVKARAILARWLSSLAVWPGLVGAVVW